MIRPNVSNLYVNRVTVDVNVFGYKAMLTLYWRGLLFTHNTGKFCVISVTERNCAAPMSNVERHISDRLCAEFWCSWNRYSNRSKSG